MWREHYHHLLDLSASTLSWSFSYVEPDFDTLMIEAILNGTPPLFEQESLYSGVKLCMYLLMSFARTG